MNTPASRRAYGREPPKSHAEKNTLANDFFNALTVPDAWQFLGWRRVVDPADGTLLSIGAVFRDKRTKGLGLKDYLVCFITAPERGAICEKTFEDFGKPKYETVASNKTADKLNEYIKNKYNSDNQSDAPTSDGLDALREKIQAL